MYLLATLFLLKIPSTISPKSKLNIPFDLDFRSISNTSTLLAFLGIELSAVIKTSMVFLSLSYV